MSEYKLNPPTVSSYTENMMLKVLFEHKGFSEVFRESSWEAMKSPVHLGCLKN